MDLAAHEVSHDAAGILAGGGNDVDPLKVIGVARVLLDLGLGSRAGQGQGGLHHAGLVGKFDDFTDAAEMFQVGFIEIQHGDLVAEDAGARVNADLLLVFGIGNGVQPLDGFFLIQLNAQAVGGIKDLFEFFFLCGFFHFQSLLSLPEIL